MKIYDISVGISSDMPVWPGDPAVKLARMESIAAGAHANVSRLECSVHIGTHVDAPLHFVDGMYGVDKMALEDLIGEARVVEMQDVDHIDAPALDGAGIPATTRRVLFRTWNSGYWADPGHDFHRDFVAIEPDGAQWLKDHGVRLVGVDYLSVAPFGHSTPTHRILLEAGIVVIEGLDLRNVAAGEYELICLPIKLMGSDGSPARAVLRQR
jgi:arylformamidase